jgi:hypothetical protein
MTPADILTQAAAAGLTIILEAPDRLRLRGPSDARERWLPEVRVHKAALLELLTAPEAPDPDPPCWRWLVTHAPGDVRSHSFCPPATLAQVRTWYPTAMAIAPEGEP